MSHLPRTTGRGPQVRPPSFCDGGGPGSRRSRAEGDDSPISTTARDSNVRTAAPLIVASLYRSGSGARGRSSCWVNRTASRDAAPGSRAHPAADQRGCRCVVGAAAVRRTPCPSALGSTARVLRSWAAGNCGGSLMRVVMSTASSVTIIDGVSPLSMLHHKVTDGSRRRSEPGSGARVQTRLSSVVGVWSGIATRRLLPRGRRVADHTAGDPGGYPLRASIAGESGCPPVEPLPPELRAWRASIGHSGRRRSSSSRPRSTSSSTRLSSKAAPLATRPDGVVAPCRRTHRIVDQPTSRRSSTARATASGRATASASPAARVLATPVSSAGLGAGTPTPGRPPRVAVGPLPATGRPNATRLEVDRRSHRRIEASTVAPIRAFP